MTVRSFSRGLVAAGLVAAVAVGCGGDGGTAPKLQDPAATLAAFEAYDSALATPVYESFTKASLYLTFAGAASTSPVAALLRATGPDLAELTTGRFQPTARRVDAVKALAPAFSQAGPQGPIIPDQLYGTTFEWNIINQQYFATSRPGAPANGVRAILYAINPLTQLPSDPLTEVGTLDLLDESFGNTLQLHVIVRGLGGTPTYLDYTASASAGTTGTNFSVSSSGFVSNGASGSALRRLDFSVVLSGSQTATGATVGIDISYDINIPSIAIDLQYDITINQNTETVTEDLFFSFQRPGETVVIDGTITATPSSFTVNLEVRINGGRFAIIRNVGQGIEVVDGSGNPLSQEQAAVLERLFFGVTEVLDDAIELLGLALGLLGAGV